MVEHLNCAQ